MHFLAAKDETLHRPVQNEKSAQIRLPHVLETDVEPKHWGNRKIALQEIVLG